MSRPAGPPLHLQGALSGPSVLLPPSPPAPGRSRSDALGTRLLCLDAPASGCDERASPDAPRCVTSALAARQTPSTAEWRPGEPLRLRRQSAELCAKTHALELGVAGCRQAFAFVLREAGRPWTVARELRDFNGAGFPSCNSSRKQWSLLFSCLAARASHWWKPDLAAKLDNPSS